MADEDKLKVQSLPPPPTDEIDDDWGSSGTAAPSPQKASEGDGPKSSGSKRAKAEEQPKKKAARPEPEDEDDDDEESDDADDEEDEGEDDDDEDDDDDDDDEDDDDEDDDEPRRARGKPSAGSSFDDLIPDWLPWGTLGGLLLLGFLGGIGVIPIDCNLKRAEATAAPASSTAPATTTTTTATARPTAARSARPARPEDGEMVAASHLLVAYKGALRAAPTTTRTKEEAKKRAMEAQEKASKKGADFEKLVAEYSDEPGAAARGGKLGKFTRGRMVKEFADAAFAMKVGEISDVVETQFGFHVIKRTE